jgi:hypothetical protein
MSLNESEERFKLLAQQIDDIKNLKHKHELQRILNEPLARNNERLFLVCFLRDQLQWSEYDIILFLEFYNVAWSNYDKCKTTRHVNMIFEKKKSGRFKDFGPLTSGLIMEETQGGQRHFKTETSTLLGAVRKYGDGKYGSVCSSVFPRVSTKQETNMATIKETRVVATINSGSRWYKICEKEGKHGTFSSLDSGPLLEVTTQAGESAVGYGRPDRYFSLPKDKTVLRELINGLEQLIPEEGEKKKRK